MILSGYVTTGRDIVATIAAAVSIALLRLVWKLGERTTRLEALEEARRLDEPEPEPDHDWLGP